MMDLARGNRGSNKNNMKDMNCEGIQIAYDDLVIIKVTDSLVLRVLSRSLLLAVFILTLPFIGSIFWGTSRDVYDASGNVFDITGFESFPMIFQDLADEGLLQKGHKGLILSSGIGESGEDLQFLYDNDIDLVIESDLKRQSAVPNEAFDVVFLSSFEGTSKFVDRILRVGGIVVMQLSNDPSNVFQQDSNYKIVYLRRFDATVVAMRKTELVDCSKNSPQKHRLCGITTKAKKDALKVLEDVWLEPPRRAMAKSSNEGKKFKFLPDLLGDSLVSYPRRVFITDEKRGSVEWFKENYPTRDQEFEIYDLEIEMNNNKENVGRGLLSKEAPLTVGISDWMSRNVKDEDYVVMKAEAQMVEDMVNEKTINLVDELFLECKNQWQHGNKSKRAYWQCLSLYGRLRDEGIAVHQWWN